VRERVCVRKGESVRENVSVFGVGYSVVHVCTCE
jgi:hypothetical protein